MAADKPILVGSTTELTENDAEFTDTVFRVVDDGDNTKKVSFQLSGVTTATTRTLTVPDQSGTLAVHDGGGPGTAGSVYFADANGLLREDNDGLFWDDTNKRLGVNTAAPGTAMHVVTTAQQPLQLKSSNAIRAQFNCGSTNTGQFVTAEFVFVMTRTDAAEKGAARLLAGKTEQWTATASTNNGYIAFQTRNAGALATAMTIDEVQDVGIGTATPGEKLDVFGNVAVRSDDKIFLEGAGSDTYIHYNTTSGDVEIFKNGVKVANW